MDTFIETPGGRINTSYASDAIKEAAAKGIYQYVSPEGKARTALTGISTDTASETLAQKLDKLNTYSPATNPNYQAPEKKKEETKPAPVPKAYFVNEAGQEAEYNQEQLNDPATQRFLKEGGYAMSKTEGPTALAGEVNVLDKQINDLVSSFNSYNVDADPSFAAQAGAIRGQYDELRKEVLEAQELYNRSIDTSMKRYTPGAAAGLAFTIASEANKALGSILRKESTAIAEARNAYQSGKYTQFNNLMTQLDKIRDNKASTLSKINENLEKSLEEIRKETKRMAMDSEIVELLGAGVTDPVEISKELEFKYSSKDIADALKNLVPEGDDWRDKLSGTTRDFYILKEQGSLPGNIAELPENQQLFAYLRQEKAASTVGETGNKVTLAEARTLGLPMSIVGMSEKEIINDLQSSQVPQWFVEKTQKELQQSLMPEEMQALWDEYRKARQAEYEADEEDVANPFLNQ